MNPNGISGMNVVNKNNNMSTSSTTTSSSDAIEAKMQTLQASLRQERDKARRDYELATERLGLLRSEVESVEKAVQEREKQLASIVQETHGLQDKADLRTTVARLTQEVSESIVLLVIATF